MLPDTNWDEHGRTTFSNFTCHSIFNSLRWICSLKIHNATWRQNPIPIFAWNSTCITFVHVWWISICFHSRSRSACSQTDEQVDQWFLVVTRCIVRRTPGGNETWFAEVQVSSQKTTWRAMESTWHDGSTKLEVEFSHGNLHLHLRPKNTYPRGDVTVKTKMVICDPSYMNPL